MAKKKKPEAEEKPYTFSDENTRKKIHKHLEDIKDVITDDDIKDVKIPGKDLPSAPQPDDKNTLEGKAIKEEVDKNADDKKQITPWDILNE